MADFTIKRNDTKPYLNVTLRSNGAPIDLTDCTVRFHMKMLNAGAAKVDASADIVDALAGAVEYRWVAGDTDTEGTYNAEFEVVDAAGGVFSFPNGHDGTDYFTIEIPEDLA